MGDKVQLFRGTAARVHGLGRGGSPNRRLWQSMPRCAQPLRIYDRHEESFSSCIRSRAALSPCADPLADSFPRPPARYRAPCPAFCSAWLSGASLQSWRAPQAPFPWHIRLPRHSPPLPWSVAEHGRTTARKPDCRRLPLPATASRSAASPVPLICAAQILWWSALCMHGFSLKRHRSPPHFTDDSALLKARHRPLQRPQEITLRMNRVTPSCRFT